MGQKVHPVGFRLGFSQNHQSNWFVKSCWYEIYVLEDLFLRNYLRAKFKDAQIINIGIDRKADLIKLDIVAAQPRAFLAGQKLITASGAGVKSKGGLVSKETQESFGKPHLLDNITRNLTIALINYRKKALFGAALGFAEQAQQAEQAKHTRAQHQKLSYENTLFIGPPLIEISIKKLNSPFTSASFIADAIALDLEKRIAFRRAMKSAVQRAQKAGVQGIKIQISGRLNGAEIARSEWIRKGRIPLHTLNAIIDYTCKHAQTLYGIIGIKVWIFQGMYETKQ